MRKIDYHMHSYFSADSDENPRNQVVAAINQGLDEICFTDHQDFNYPKTDFSLAIEPYYQEIQALKEEFKKQIIIKWGIEIGLDRNYKVEIPQLIEKYPFDFVIGSIHVIDHTEFYDPADFFQHKTKQQAHLDFFNETLACIKEFDCFNVLGHLDYIERYGPYQDKKVEHQLYQNTIDEILKTLINKQKGIEVNTSGYAHRFNCGFPNFEIVKRYYELGGRIITIGTDSHTSDRVGEHVEDVIKHYKEIGFNDVTTFSNRKKDIR